MGKHSYNIFSLNVYFVIIMRKAPKHLLCVISIIKRFLKNKKKTFRCNCATFNFHFQHNSPSSFIIITTDTFGIHLKGDGTHFSNDPLSESLSGTSQDASQTRITRRQKTRYDVNFMGRECKCLCITVALTF